MDALVDNLRYLLEQQFIIVTCRIYGYHIVPAYADQTVSPLASEGNLSYFVEDLPTSTVHSKVPRVRVRGYVCQDNWSTFPQLEPGSAVSWHGSAAWDLHLQIPISLLNPCLVVQTSSLRHTIKSYTRSHAEPGCFCRALFVQA